MMRGRTIYYQNRRILVFCGEKRKKPHSVNDEFATTAETATTGENAEARTTETSEFAEAESGGAIGSEDDPLITSSEFSEAASGISTTQSVHANVYRHHLKSVTSGIATDHDCKALHSHSVLPKSASGADLNDSADALKTSIAIFADADEGIGTGNENESFKTEQNKKAEAESGISSLQEISAKTTGTELSDVESGISTTQIADAYVEQPAPQYIIQASKYIATGTQFSAPLPTMDKIDVDVSFEKSGTAYTYHGLSVTYFSAFQLCYLLTEDEEEAAVFLGHQVATLDDPFKFYMSITTDDQSFTVENDVEVTAEQYDVFNRYFELAPAFVIEAGNYAGNSQISAFVKFEVYIPISYGYGGLPSVASSIEVEEYGSIIAWRDKEQEEDGDVIGYADLQNGCTLGTDNEIFTVTNDTVVTSSEYAAFFNYFHLVT